jgi:FkbM family methyltransferase
LRHDNLGEPLLAGEFEAAEMAFVERFLQPGMTVLDVGAHHGLYSLLASARVGARGTVFAFEPSPRERRALRLNLLLNLAGNVSVQGLALGSDNGEQNLFVVQGSQRGCNSLRPPEVFSATIPVRVRVVPLDEWLVKQKIDHVNFIKLDVEGGELDFFRGASKLLRQAQAPLILCELQDIRTKAWGHTAREAADFVRDFGYKWFRPLDDGMIERMPELPERYEGNFIAVPQPKLRGLKEMIRDGSDLSS